MVARIDASGVYPYIEGGGSEPSESSTLYSDPFGVSTALTVTAKTFPSNGWSASPTATASLTFNFGELAPPTADPAGAAFLQAPQVTLSSIAGATIRYTLNGATPTESSTLYAGLITIPGSGATLKAKAFHQDWTPSAERVDTYVVDTTAPAIVARRFPSPLNTWHMTPVTVTFACTDNYGIASCSSPTTVTAEGAAQIVSGSATDTVGNQVSVQDTLNLDLTPPLVTLTAPADGLVTTNATVQLSGQVSDALSGLEAVMCNGEAATVVDGVASCTVALRPGRNDLALTARDLAGHSVSSGVTVTRVGTSTLITLTPSTRTMVVSETGGLSLRDNFGIPVSGALWSSSDPAIVSVSADDPPVLTALAAGEVTITAEKNGLNSTATLTVVAGEALAEGTTRWTVAPTPSSEGMRQDPPIYTHRTDATVPDLFTVEKNVTTEEHTVRALSSSGEVQWTMIAPGVPLMGDEFGGLVAGVDKPGVPCRAVYGEFEFCYKALARFAGTAGTASWRYDTAGYLDRPAQGPDGTIYAIEHLLGAYSYEKTIVILNGATGQVTARVPLKNRITDIRVVNGSCQSSYSEEEPQSVGPIVAGDGFGYLLVTNRTWNGIWNCGAQAYESSTDDVGLELLRLSKDGLVDTEVIQECTNCGEPTPRQLLPDGIGGLLVVSESWNGTTTVKTVTRLDGSGARVDTPIELGTRIELIGQDGAAYLNRMSGINNSVGKKVVDVRNFTTRYTVPPEWSWLAATPNGGARVEGADGQLGDFDGTGQLIGTAASIGITSPVQQFGDLVGHNSLTGMRAVVMPFDDATVWDQTYRAASPSTEEPRRYGSYSNQNAPPGFFANYNAIDLFTTQSPTQIFDQFVRTYDALTGNTVVAVGLPNGPITGVGQIAEFTLLGTFGISFSVETIRFDATDQVFAAKTLPGHPLFGCRYWKVIQLGPGRIRVETGAVDKPAPFMAPVYWFKQNDQIKTWSEYMEYIRDQLSAVQDVSRPNALRIMRGIWNPDKTYIMKQVCGSDPVPGTWVCQ